MLSIKFLDLKSKLESMLKNVLGVFEAMEKTTIDMVNNMHCTKLQLFIKTDIKNERNRKTEQSKAKIVWNTHEYRTK